MIKKFFIGIDIGGTKIYGGLVHPKGGIVHRKKIPTPGSSSSKRTIQAICDVIKDLLADKGLGVKNISGIGLGIPGLVNAKTGEVQFTPNMCLSGVNIVKDLKKRFHTSIVIGNDADAGILGEKWMGAAKGSSEVLGLFLGTGLGGGIIVNNELLMGFAGVASEIGHMIVDPSGPRCGCGNRGCLEAFVGRWAIERDIKDAIKKGEKPLLGRLAKKKLKKIKSGMLRKALLKKDPIVTRIINKSSLVLGRACVSLRHLFDPEMIIFGGGVIEACGDFIIPVVRKALKEDKLFQKRKLCRVKRSILGDDATVLGAVALVKRYRGERI